MERENGFYWVKSDAWEVMRWNGFYWQDTCGYDHERPHSLEINETRILNPDEQ